MRTLTLLATALAFSANAVAAEPPQLARWVTDTIGMTNGSQCVLPESTPLPSVPPTLTEKDVAAWNAAEGKWRLDPIRFAGDEGAYKLADRCFVLAIDGQLMSSGLALFSYSARLTGFPVLIINTRDKAVDLQLLAGNHVGRARLLHVDKLDKVFRPNATSAR